MFITSSLKKSYRLLKDGLLQLTLANDYASFVPFIYPTSADYFLQETHRGLISEPEEDKVKKMKISEILKLVEASNTELRTIFAEYKADEGRVLLINFLKGLVWNRYSAKQFRELVGVNAATEITLDEFTLWLFHDLLILKVLKR